MPRASWLPVVARLVQKAFVFGRFRLGRSDCKSANGQAETDANDAKPGEGERALATSPDKSSEDAAKVIKKPRGCTRLQVVIFMFLFVWNCRLEQIGALRSCDTSPDAYSSCNGAPPVKSGSLQWSA